ncbi:MAG TPA: GMC family oxidoreductase N-terminal domain-containing protein [Acidimicrobiales bacterium]|nr:GMC family oxidoreductase N-terminal domain-containing protein [Acidimicrobiales bacterium]
MAVQAPSSKEFVGPYDYLIVGAGTAGCALAHRLSTNGATVLLIEAGMDTPPGSVPNDIYDLYPRSYYNESYTWRGLRAQQLGGGMGVTSPFTQARVMGGGSSLMGMLALRGLPDDYDSWGIPGWSWSDVLPYFRALEDDRDFSGELHGSGGPITIRRHHERDWPPFCSAVGRATAKLGWPMIGDLNGEFGDGYGALPLSSTLSGRVSASSGYLDTATRSRPNLVIRCETVAEGLEFSGTQCVGAFAVNEDGLQRYRARHTIVCAGALHSPALLMRSGIGPADHLRTLGIRVVSALSGVGANLQNHPVVYLASHLVPGARQSPSLRPGFNTALRFGSHGRPSRPGELQMLVLNKSSWHGLGSAIAGLGICLLAPLSRGTVLLRSADRELPLDIRFRMLSEAADVELMVEGFETACTVMLDDEVRSLRHETFAAGYSGVVRRLNKPGPLNVVLTNILSQLLDGPDFLRRSILKWGIASGDVGEDRLTSTSWRQRTVRSRSFGTYHPAGTCRMGPADDPSVVTQADGRVMGVEGLSVVDASIIPTIPRANTFVPVLMVAERAADLILARDK